mmetsp:Transcript_10247/g.37975  ORF Transcript_10247/g.37975 Transcript_10247/m.37975 type:complete len:127 (+) Transcript_10247:71-451(+)
MRTRHTRSARPPRQHTMAGLAQSAVAFWNHPAGPKTIFFWAPTMKWGITAANIKDFSRPPELLSTAQQAAVATTGLIWMKYSLDITPKNYNLMSVNCVMAATGLYQLYRKISHDQQVASLHAKTVR